MRSICRGEMFTCCPHSRLAARQPNDDICVQAGPLKRRLAALICIVHTTGCTTGRKVKTPSALQPCTAGGEILHGYNVSQLTKARSALETPILTDMPYPNPDIHHFLHQQYVLITGNTHIANGSKFYGVKSECLCLKRR